MTPHPAAADQTAVEVDSLDFCYGSKQSLFNVTMKVPRNRVTAFIGPSGCGKSTLLRCINRMNDRIPEARVTGGSIRIDGVDVTSPSLDTIRLRREVGMVFQKSNPFPMSIYENVAYGLKLAGVKKRGILDEAVEESLRHAALWDEVKDRLHASANGLSGGQQQRLCIARSIAVKPRILLMDEPCSALDPIATVRVEELMHRLKDKFTIIVVTHNMQQATRVSDLTGFFMLGRLVEFDATEKIFSNPSLKETIMIFPKNISKNGAGRVPHVPGSGRRLAASAARKNSLRKQHLFYHAGKTLSNHQANIPNHESRRAHPEGV